MILKDRFLTQSAPDTCHKLWKQAFGPNQSLKTCCNSLRWYIKVQNMRRKIWKKKKKKEPDKRLKLQQWLLDMLWNSLRKTAQRNPDEKGWICYYCEKERHLKWDCPQASKLPPLTPCPDCKGLRWRRDCPPRCRPQGLDFLDNQGWRCPRVPT